MAGGQVLTGLADTRGCVLVIQAAFPSAPSCLANICRLAACLTRAAVIYCELPLAIRHHAGGSGWLRVLIPAKPWP